MLIDLCVCCLLFFYLRGIICGSRPFPRRTRASKTNQASGERARRERKDTGEARNNRWFQAVPLKKKCVFLGQEVVEKSRHMLIDALCVWSLVRRLWKKQAHVD